jgi:formylglycine-generating enzyme required for sulfatase activity
MVWIPAGEFLMGDDDTDIIRNNNPRRSVELSAYWIYKTPVTVGQYKGFCKLAGRGMPHAPGFNPNWSKEDHPIVNVSWDDAMAYAQWAHADLPTEVQWEKAARGTDGRKYPWGNAFDRSKLWCSRVEGDAHGTHRVGELGISPYGCWDMAGNVWEWCKDRYDDSTTPWRVLRGGSWYNYSPDNFRTALRYENNQSTRDAAYGFRCAMRADAT